MPNTHLLLGKNRGQSSAPDSITATRLDRIIKDFLRDSKSAGHSQETINTRAIYLKNLMWFLRQRKYDECDTSAMRDFMAYLGEDDPKGKWGVTYPDGRPRIVKGAAPATLASYYNHISTFFNWVVREEEIDVSPMLRVKKPKHRLQQVQPLNVEQVNALMAAAKNTNFPARDVAILCLMMDTGLRASEVCNITFKDIDLDSRQITTVGKGKKLRTVHYRRPTERALMAYLRLRNLAGLARAEMGRGDDHPYVFVSGGGNTPGERLTRSGLLRLIWRLAEKAGIQGRCYPHKLRHTFAYMMIASGSNEKTVQELLGHEDRTMTYRYVNLAQADIERQHEQHSPMNKIKV